MKLNSVQCSVQLQLNFVAEMAVLSRLLMKGCQFRWSSLLKANLLAIGRVSPKLFPSVAILSVPLVVRSFTRVSCEESKFSRVATVVANDNQLSKVPWGDILSLLRPEFWLLLTAVISAVIVAVINIQIPLLLGSLVNGIAKLSGSQDSIVSLLKPIALKLVFYYGLQAVFTFHYISVLAVMGERMAANLRLKLFQSLMAMDISFYDTKRTGELVNRLSTDIQEFKSAFKQCISQGLRSSTQTIGCVVSLYLISPKMTLITVAVLPTVVICGTLLGSMLRKLSRAAQSQAEKAIGVAEEAISNIRTVRSFAMESVEQQYFAQEVEKSKISNELLGIGIGAFQGLSNFALNGVILAVLYGGAKLIVSNEISPGHLMSFLVTSQTIQRSLAQVSVLFGQAIKGLTASSRVFEYIHLKPEIPVSGGRKIPHHSLIGNVKFNNVQFSYPNRPEKVVFDRLNLELPQGKVVALCGSSGGGKSTIVALLERFYDVNGGEITIDGIDLRQLDPKWFRGEIVGLISQEPILFGTSIRENIRYGRPNATEAEIVEAAKLAYADDFIRTFPLGYDTLVGERGASLSGGQRQRIAVARAILKNPPILILDEATSALDSESERKLQKAMEFVQKGRTVLVVAHRLSTIQNADIIAVVADRKIAEIGSHQELMRKEGLYYQLVEHQQIN